MKRDHSPSLSDCSLDQVRALLDLAAGKLDCGRSLVALAARPERWRADLDALGAGDAQSGDLLLKMVAAPGTSPRTLEAIKNQAKKLAHRSDDPNSQASCLILYHGAIAAAYGRHGAWISSRDPDAVIALYADLAQVLRADPLARVFRQAVRRHTERDLPPPP